MPIVFGAQQDPYGLQGIADPLIQALGQRTARKREEEQNIAQGTILNDVFSKVLAEKGENVSGLDLVQALTEAQKRGVAPSSIEPYSKLIPHISPPPGKTNVNNEKAAPFAEGLDTLQKMKSLIKKGNLGRGSQIWGFAAGQTAKDRAEFQQYGKSLIPLVAAGVPVRNQKEFEEYKKIITDPSAPIASLEGAVNALEDVFRRKLESYGYSENPKTSERSQSEQAGKTVKVRKKSSNRVSNVPEDAWKNLTDQQREGYEIVG